MLLAEWDGVVFLKFRVISLDKILRIPSADLTLSHHAETPEKFPSPVHEKVWVFDTRNEKFSLYSGVLATRSVTHTPKTNFGHIAR